MTWIRRLREAPVTLALIVANLIVFAVMAAWSGRLLSFDSATLIDAGASVASSPSRRSDGGWWRARTW